MSAADLWTSFCNHVLDVVYPRKCALCDQFAPDSPCEFCLHEFIPADPRLVVGETGGDLRLRAVLYRYQGRAGQAVRRLKYARATSLAPTMARHIRQAYEELSLESDLIVPVPIHWSRECTRGFNQAVLLAKELPTQPSALKRVRRTLPQAGLDRHERERNLGGAFLADPVVAGKSVLLIDDVWTSGQTARECARALKQAGAKEVNVLAFCGDL